MGIIDSIKDAMRGDDDPDKAAEATAADPVVVARAQQAAEQAAQQAAEGATEEASGGAEVVDPVDVARAQQAEQAEQAGGAGGAEEGTATAEIPTTTPPVGSGVVVDTGASPVDPAPEAPAAPEPGQSDAITPGDSHAHDHGPTKDHGHGHGHGHDDAPGPDAGGHRPAPAPDQHAPDQHAPDQHGRDQHGRDQHPAGSGRHAQRDDDLRTYTVVSGDTLSGIGAKFGVPYQEIARLNKVDNPDLIFPGQVFKIPHA